MMSFCHNDSVSEICFYLCLCLCLCFWRHFWSMRLIEVDSYLMLTGPEFVLFWLGRLTVVFWRMGPVACKSFSAVSSRLMLVLRMRVLESWTLLASRLCPSSDFDRMRLICLIYGLNLALCDVILEMMILVGLHSCTFGLHYS